MSVYVVFTDFTLSGNVIPEIMCGNSIFVLNQGTKIRQEFNTKKLLDFV